MSGEDPVVLTCCECVRDADVVEVPSVPRLDGFPASRTRDGETGGPSLSERAPLRRGQSLPVGVVVCVRWTGAASASGHGPRRFTGSTVHP